MSYRARTALPARPAALQALIAASALFVALLAGALLTRSVGLGLALVGGCAFVTIVLLDLPLAIAAWVPVAWIEYSHLTGRAPVLGTVLLVVAWLGVSRARRLAGRGWRGPPGHARPRRAARVANAVHRVVG